MNWWTILKNAKISGKTKGKGSTLDASKIKINIDKNDCKKKLVQYMTNAYSLNSRIGKNVFKTVKDLYEPEPTFEESDEWKELTEEDACEIIKLIDLTWLFTNTFMNDIFEESNFKTLTNNPDILKVDVGNNTFRRRIERRMSKLYISYDFGPDGEDWFIWGIQATLNREDLGNVGSLDWRK